MNKQIYITTPQGTMLLNEYGSFKEMNEQNINASSWHKINIVKPTGFSQQVLGRVKRGYPLPPLAQINAHVKHGFPVLMDEKQQRDKHYAEGPQWSLTKSTLAAAVKLFIMLKD